MRLGFQAPFCVGEATRPALSCRQRPCLPRLAVPDGAGAGVGGGHWGRPTSSGRRAVQRFHPLWALPLPRVRLGRMASPWACFSMPVGTPWSPPAGPGGACDGRTWGVGEDTRGGPAPSTRQLGRPRHGTWADLNSASMGGRAEVGGQGVKRQRRRSPLAVSTACSVGGCFWSDARTAVRFSFLPPARSSQHTSSLGSISPENWIPGPDSQRVCAPGPGRGAGTGTFECHVENRPLRPAGPEDEGKAEPSRRTREHTAAGAGGKALRLPEPAGPSQRGRSERLPRVRSVAGWEQSPFRHLWSLQRACRGQVRVAAVHSGGCGPHAACLRPWRPARLLPGVPLPGRAPAEPLRPHLPPASTPAFPGGAGPRGLHTAWGWPFSIPSAREPPSRCMHTH